MGLYFRKEIDMVEVRRYCGVEDGRNAWEFLGYDFILKEKNGKKGTSILALEPTKYQYLPIISDPNRRGFGLYDHSGVKVGDIRVVSSSIGLHLFEHPIVSSEGLRKWAENSTYSFVHQKEKIKVKILSSK